MLPVVLGLGCVTRAAMTTRILGTHKERVIATLLLTLSVPYSAWLGVELAMLLPGTPVRLTQKRPVPIVEVGQTELQLTTRWQPRYALTYRGRGPGLCPVIKSRASRYLRCTPPSMRSPITVVIALSGGCFGIVYPAATCLYRLFDLQVLECRYGPAEHWACRSQPPYAPPRNQKEGDRRQCLARRRVRRKRWDSVQSQPGDGRGGRPARFPTSYWSPGWPA